MQQSLEVGKIGLEEHKSFDVFSMEVSSAAYELLVMTLFGRIRIDYSDHYSVYESNIRYIPSENKTDGCILVPVVLCCACSSVLFTCYNMKCCKRDCVDCQMPSTGLLLCREESNKSG